MFKILAIILFSNALGKLLKSERRLQLDKYIMDPIERMEQSKYLSGAPPQVNRIQDMSGGLLNVVLGKEGAPVYIDQSPSYLYHDPKSEFNQNGVKLPMPQQNKMYGAEQNRYLTSNFIKPSNYDNTETVVLPSITQGTASERRLSKLKVRTIASSDKELVNLINPDGVVVRTKMRDSYPEDVQYHIEGAEELRRYQKDSERQQYALELVHKIQDELTDMKIKIGEKDDKVDSLLNRIYALKVT